MKIRQRSAVWGLWMLGFGAIAAAGSWPLARAQDRSSSETQLRSLIDASRYEQAEEAGARLVASVTAQAGADSLETARAIDLLVEALLRNGKGAQGSTLSLAVSAFRIKETHRRTDEVEGLPSWRNYAHALIDAGQVRQAVPLLERALAIHETWLGSQNLATADALNDLARALSLTNRYDDAKKLLDRALSIEETGKAADDERAAVTLEQLANLHQRSGDYTGARPLLERALRIREASGRTDPALIETLNLLGRQLYFEGDPRAEQALYVRALNIGQRVLRPNHPLIARVLKNMAFPATTLGDLAQAHELQARALSIAEQNYPPSHPEIAEYLNDLANTGFLQGDYSAPRALYERATRIAENTLGSDDLMVATYIYNLANLDARLGDLVEARRELDRAVAIWQRVLGPDHPFVARAFGALGGVLLDRGLYADAQTFLERALKIRERSLGPNHADVARTLDSLAGAAQRLGQLTRARELSARAVATWERSGAPQAATFATILTQHAELQASAGDFDAARQSYERALTIRDRIVGRAHPDYAETEAGLAVALAGLGDSKSAIASALDAEGTGRQQLRLTVRYLPERQSLGYDAKRPRGLDLAISLSAPGVASDGRLFDALVRSRALVLDEMAARRHVSTDASRADLAPLWTALASTRQRLANLVVRGPSDRQPQQYVTLVEDARREKELAERALVDKSAAFRAELARGEIGFEEVRTALPARSALVSFVRYGRTVFTPGKSGPLKSATSTPARRTVPSYVAFVVRAGEADVSIIPLGSARSIDDLVSRWRENVIPGAAGAEETDSAPDQNRSIGTKLRQRVWDPFAEILRGVQTAFVVPDGSLSLVAFDALPLGQSRYVIDRGPVIHYLSAERDLVASRDPSPPGNGLLAVGGPTFGSNISLAESATTSKSSAALRTAASPCPSLQTLQFPQLPASSREARDVARLWQAADGDEAGGPSLLLGQSANERAFKDQAPGRRVLHLATHGFFLGDACEPAVSGTRAVGGVVRRQAPNARVESENPLLLSGLAFAGANRRTAPRAADDEDGILLAEEVAALNLGGVEWAVLSACDTGLGEIKAGEGVFGLRRAFQVAGARTVIMSLWSVDDQAARLWMHALYEGRLQKHLSTADAMHQASLSMLRARRARGLSTNPFYWAGFVAAGDWR